MSLVMSPTRYAYVRPPERETVNRRLEKRRSFMGPASLLRRRQTLKPGGVETPAAPAANTEVAA